MSFGFLEQFDPDEAKKPKRPALKTAAELDEAAADAHARGFEEGYAKGAEKAESEFATAALKLAKAMSVATEKLAEERILHEAAFRKALAAIVARIASPIAEDAFPHAVSDLVAERLESAQSKLVLRADPAWAEPLRDIAEAADGDVDVVPDPQLSGMIAEISWENGLSELDFEDAISRILTLLNDADAEPQQTERAVNE